MKTIKSIEHNQSDFPDQLVVKKILEGEKLLFEVLMRRHNQLLYRTIRGYLNQEVDIEDVIQECYLKAFKNLHQYRFEASFSTWLIRIGINEALQQKRKLSKQENLSGDGSNWDEVKLLQSTNRPMDPEKKVIQAETKLMIESAIDKLPEKYRVIYILKEIEGMKNKDIVNALNITESNVKVRNHRAKILLKDELLKMSSDTNLFEFGNSKCDKIVQWVMSRI